MVFADDFAKQLSRDMELSEVLTPDESGTYRFALRDDIAIEMRPFGEGVAFSADVGLMPQTERSEKFCLTLLLANLLGQGSGSAHLGLNKKADHILLNIEIPGIMLYMECRDKLEDFLNDTDFWVSEVAEPERLMARLD